jgi:hypothetical protein
MMAVYKKTEIPWGIPVQPLLLEKTGFTGS